MTDSSGEGSDSRKAAESTYAVRIDTPLEAAQSDRRSGWWNAVNNVMSAFSTMFSGGDGSPPGAFPKRDVKLIHISSGATVAMWRDREDAARNLAALIARDLSVLDVHDFEAEWNISPTTVPRRPR